MTGLLIATSLLQFFGGSLVYVRNTLLGRSQPNRVTFFLWAVGPFIAGAAALVHGASWALLPVFMAGLGPLAIFLASFANPKAYWRLTMFDYACGTFAVLALVLWGITANPALAVFFSILSDGFAALPTLIKAWKRPETETSVSYILAFINVCVGIIALQARDFVHVGFLAYLLVSDGAVMFAILRKHPLKHLRADFARVVPD